MNFKILQSYNICNKCSQTLAFSRCSQNVKNAVRPSGNLLRQDRFFHQGKQLLKKEAAERPSAPYKFSSSKANIKSMKAPVMSNPYEKHILTTCIFVFGMYWFVLREENDLDEELNVSLFDRVPNVEEPHLRQAIPRMRAAGVDTTEAEMRLKELVAARKAREAAMNKFWGENEQTNRQK